MLDKQITSSDFGLPALVGFAVAPARVKALTCIVELLGRLYFYREHCRLPQLKYHVNIFTISTLAK